MLESALSQAIECKKMNELNYMTDYSDHIGIIGGGIAGLALGCALLKEGIPTVIFEKRHSDGRDELIDGNMTSGAICSDD